MQPARMSRSAGTLSRLLDAAPIGMAVTSSRGETLYTNAALAALLGYPALEQHPFDIFSWLDPEDGVSIRLQLDRLGRGEMETLRGEYRVRHADGSSLWVMISANRFCESDQPEPLLIIQLTSIELQKKAEAAVAYSESRLNYALESARQGVWDHDIRTDTMFYSRMWRVMRGIPPGEAVGKDHQDLWLARVHPDDRERVLREIERQDRGDDDFDALEYRELTRDGRYIWILSRGRPVEWDEQGNPVRTLGTDTDITRLKTMEGELAAEKQRLRVTLEAVADGIISTDAHGLITFMNPAAEQLTGHAVADAMGRPAASVFVVRREEDGGPAACPVATCLLEGRRVEPETGLVLIARDGATRDIRCAGSPVIMPDGQMAGVVLVFQDMTQSRALHRQLAHSAAHDALTGLPNRAAFDRALAAVMDRVGSACRMSGSLVYIDLDRFKPVNDTAGHAAGDALLKQVGRTIRETCRNHDLAARVGGDEFALILEDCPVDQGRRVAEKIVRAITALEFTWSGRTYRIGASAGVSEISGSPNSPLGALGEADAACYAAKGAGRGRVMVFGEMIDPAQP